MLNWGLFLGGKVDCNGHRFILKYIAPSNHIYGAELLMPVDYAGYLQSGFLPDECKPVLRPLSSMTEEEKKEFNTKFDCEVTEFKLEDKVVKPYVVAMMKSVTVISAFDLKKLCADSTLPAWCVCDIPEVIWLMSRRFFVGQCEITECIIEGGINESGKL